MVADNDPRPVLRQELSRIFKNQRVIRAFEKIFDLIPPEFIDQQIQIDTISLLAEVAAGQSAESIAAIERLASALDRLATAPPTTPEAMTVHNVDPRTELGDVKLNSVECISPTGVALLLASGVTLANGAAAAAGTIANAPAAGNPTKWVPINDNGTIRYIPSW